MISRATRLSATGNNRGLTSGLALDLAFAADKSLTARRGPTPTFSRASAATQVGATGLIEWAPANLINNSENVPLWLNVAALRFITPNAVNSPIGTLTADFVGFSSSTGVDQNLSVTPNAAASIESGQVITASIWMRTPSGSGVVYLSAACIGASRSRSWVACNVTTEWQRFSVTHTVPSGVSGASYILVGPDTRSSFGGLNQPLMQPAVDVHIWGAQLERHPSAREYIPTTTAAVFGPRFDHDPVTLASRGLLIEEQRTNLLQRSEEFDNAYWSLFDILPFGSGSVANTTATLAPNGTNTADKIVENTNNVAHRIQCTSSTATIGTAYTFSVFLKRAERGFAFIGAFNAFSTAPYVSVNLTTGAVALANGTVASFSSVGYPNGWWRVSITIVADGALPMQSDIRISTDGLWANRNYTGDGTSGIFIWGAQLEVGSFPTSYIPTTTASVIRSSDVCSIAGSAFTSFWNQNEGTIVVVGDKTMSQNTTGSYLTFQAGATEVGPLITRTSTSLLGRIRNNAGQDLTNLDLSESPSGIKRIAVAWRATSDNNDRDFASGGLILPKTNPIAGTAANSQTNLLIGSRPSSAIFNGHISSLQYYRRRLTNAQLQSLTFITAISGFAYPSEILTSTRAGQWFVNDVAVIGETGSTYTVRLTDIGLPIRCENSNVLTCWHPNQIAAVARFWWASRNALNSVSPDVLATNGQTVRRWNGILSGTPADQASAPSQPIWRSSGQSGNPSIEFDGVDDRFALPSNTDVFQNRSQGYLIIGCRDTNRTGGESDHVAAFYSIGTGVATRLSVLTRTGTNSFFAAGTRRQDGDGFTSAQAPSNANYNVLGSHGDWSNGFVRLRVNGSVASSTALASGSGSTSNTPSQNAVIGGAPFPGTNFFPGHITAVCAINAPISATDLSRIERFIGLMGGLNIPLV